MQQLTSIINEKILESIPAIVLTWDESGKILPGFSDLSLQLFGKGLDLTGKKIDDILCGGSGTLTDLTAMLFTSNREIDFDSLMDLAPDELSLSGSFYQLHYQPIYDGKQLGAVMVYGRDITNEKLLEEKREKEIWQNAMFLEIIKDRSLFQTFYSESIKSLHKASRILSSGVITKESIDELFRVVHSVKGSGASFRIKPLLEEAHELEHELDLDRKIGSIDNVRQVERSLLNLEKTLTRTYRQVISIAGEFTENIKRIDDEEVEQLRKAFTNGNRQKAEEIFDGLALPQLKHYLADRAQSVFNSTLNHLANKDAVLFLEVEAVRVPVKVIEALEMSLPHLIRNSLDHGLEQSSEREKAGKHPQGRLKIAAFVEDSKYIIKLTDDGKGVSPEIVGKIAVNKGVLSQSELDAMSEQSRQELIFAPGFSTAEEISEISGRGVGMDSVKMKIEELDGTIQLKSVVGKGSQFTIEIPVQN